MKETYLSEGMLDDLLSIGIGDSREEIPQDSVGLSINFCLTLWYRFWFARSVHSGGMNKLPVALQHRTSLVGYHLPKMVANAVHMVLEIIRIFGVLE